MPFHILIDEVQKLYLVFCEWERNTALFANHIQKTTPKFTANCEVINLIGRNFSQNPPDLVQILHSSNITTVSKTIFPHLSKTLLD